MWKVVVLFLAAVYAVGLGIPGGISDTDANDKNVQEALKFAVDQHNDVNNVTHIRKVTDVIKAQIQVVAGLLYHLNVNLANTNCSSDTKEVNELCDIQTDPKLAQSFQCNFTVWSRAWLNDTRLTKHTCVENKVNLVKIENSE
ncbi:cystatin [Austrofundulus limnaeus]|uniref:Cystatin n=1 Tax=Austrofundulus limnaeus TaxID=52670 RepID=A0A2I4B125_AUSLI|nr:PREDICTED: cystatin-like [Austrofundulus limnaeus]